MGISSSVPAVRLRRTCVAIICQMGRGSVCVVCIWHDTIPKEIHIGAPSDTNTTPRSPSIEINRIRFFSSFSLSVLLLLVFFSSLIVQTIFIWWWTTAVVAYITMTDTDTVTDSQTKSLIDKQSQIETTHTQIGNGTHEEDERKKTCSPQNVRNQVNQNSIKSTCGPNYNKDYVGRGWWRPNVGDERRIIPGSPCVLDSHKSKTTRSVCTTDRNRAEAKEGRIRWLKARRLIETAAQEYILHPTKTAIGSSSVCRVTTTHQTARWQRYRACGAVFGHFSMVIAGARVSPINFRSTATDGARLSSRALWRESKAGVLEQQTRVLDVKSIRRILMTKQYAHAQREREI